MKLKICVGTPCHLMGAQKLISIAQEFKVKEGVDLDIEAVSCLEECEEAPAVELAGRIQAPSIPQDLIDLIKAELNYSD
ncbi:NAD(P)H-dependent oxidoreductase subunit E [Halanaerobaculum tunisiense]